MDFISIRMNNRSTVYDEIRQERPFDRPERELAVVLLRTGDVFHHSLTRALAPFDLSTEQYNALRILKGAGDYEVRVETAFPRSNLVRP